MAFGRSDREESGGSEGRSGGNRPDCAYFLLLGLCGAAFLLTIGGILTYIAFNPGSVDSRPHSPLSHIPHFHHHRKHHDRTEGHYFGHLEQHHEELKQHSVHDQHQGSHHSASSTHNNMHTTITPTEKMSTPLTIPQPTVSSIESNETKKNGESGDGTTENWTTPGNHLETSHLNETGNKKEENSSITSSSTQQQQSKNPQKELNETGHNEHFGLTHHNYNKSNSSHHHHPLLDPSSSSSHHLNQQQMHPHPGLVSSVTHHEGNNSNGYEFQAKQSLALAIIGPLCLLMGIIVTLIVGVFALKYDCDHEPEPNIAFLRLRSEMSLNFDASKNNYELLMPASSSTAGVGSTHSIHPGGMPRC